MKSELALGRRGLLSAVVCAVAVVVAGSACAAAVSVVARPRCSPQIRWSGDRASGSAAEGGARMVPGRTSIYAPTDCDVREAALRPAAAPLRPGGGSPRKPHHDCRVELRSRPMLGPTLPARLPRDAVAADDPPGPA
jgi:hypothetical protein